MILTCIVVLCFFNSCKKHSSKDSSGYIYYSPEDIYYSAENIYLGELLGFGDETKEKRLSYGAVETLVSIDVKVISVYKGKIGEQTEVKDWIPEKYINFLKEGGEYLFSTGIQTLKDSMGNEVNYFPRFNLYDAVYLKEHQILEYFGLEQARKECEGSYNQLPNPPKTLAEIENRFQTSQDRLTESFQSRQNSDFNSTAIDSYRDSGAWG